MQSLALLTVQALLLAAYVSGNEVLYSAVFPICIRITWASYPFVKCLALSSEPVQYRGPKGLETALATDYRSILIVHR